MVEQGTQEVQCELKITWDDALGQFDNLIKFAARQQVENRGSDNSVSAEDLYQEGLVKLWECHQKWCVERNKDMDEFGPIFRKSLFRKVKQTRRASGKGNVDLDDVAPFIQDPNTQDVVHTMHIKESLSNLAGMLSSDISRMVLQELIDPSARTIYEAIADHKRRQMLKSQGKRVNVPKDYTVRMKHIVRSLGITGKQYDNAIIDIRQNAPVVFS